jgi:hypothetical protein
MAEVAIQVVASIGFNLLNGLLNPIKTEGPRASQGDTPTSQYGSPISEYWGRGRGSGTLIWAIDKQETSQREGGKGQERTTYKYYGSFAYCVGRGGSGGQLDVETIFLNNKVWWSIAPGTTPEQLQLNKQREAFFTWYRGTQTQLPDPLIQSYRGVNRTPAYRGYSYIVFKGLPLEEWGNTFPVPSFVVVSSTATTISSRDRKGMVEGVPYTVKVTAYDNTGAARTLTAVTPNAVWGVRIMNVHPVVARYPRGEVQLYGPDYTLTIAAGREWGKAGPTKPGSVSITDISPAGVAVPSVAAAATALSCAAAVAPVGFNVYRVQYTRASDLTVQSVGFSGWAPFRVTGPGDEAVATPTPATYFNDPANFDSSAPPEPFTDRILDATGAVKLVDAAGILGIHGWEQFSLPVRSLNYSSPTVGPQVQITHCVPNTLIEPGSISYVAPTLASIVEYALLSCGIKTGQYDLSGLIGLTAIGYKLTSVQPARSFIEELQRIYLFTISRTGGKITAVRYGEVAASTPLSLLTTENDDATPGSAYQVEIIDPSALPITFQLGYGSTGKNLEFSSQIARRYRPGQNLLALTGSGPSSPDARNAYETVDTQAIFTEDDAVTRAYQMFSILLGSQRSYKWAAPIQSLTLGLAEILTARFPYGLEDYEDVVSIKSIDLGNDYTLRIEAVSYDETFKTISLGTESTPSTSISSATGGASNIVVLDIPIWRSVTGSDSVIYAGLYGATSSWRGGSIFISLDDGSTFTLLTTLAQAVTTGEVTQVLLPMPDVALVDLVSRPRIKIPDGAGTALQSISVAQFDRLTSNIVLMGREIIQYQNATLVGPREYELSVIRRGWYGTQSEMNTHLIGERATALDDALTTIEVPTTELNQVLVVRAVSTGQAAASGTNLNAIPRGNGLRALPVVNLTAQIIPPSNDTRFRWNRVPRKFQGFADYVDAPLNESIEQYSIEVFNSLDQLVRTFTSTTPDFLYAGIERLADMGSLSASFSVRIYQVTPIIGRGFDSKLIVQP